MKPSNTVTTILKLAVVASTLMAAALAPAAQDVTDFARTTSPLTASQKTQLDTFISNGTKGLASNDPETVMESRDELISVLTRHGTTPVFREAFGENFVSSASSIFKTKRLFNSHNAYRVLAYIRTGNSNEFLASQLSSSTNPNAADRIFASNMLALSLRTTSSSLIRPRQYAAIIRAIQQSAEQEHSWVILQHAFESLVEIGSNSDIPEEIRLSAVRSQGKILQTTADRIGKDDAVNLAKAISPIVLMLRTEFISLESPAIRKSFQESLLPGLIAVISAGEDGWESLQAQLALRNTYGDAIFQSTVLARMVVGGSQAPSSDPAKAWRDGQRRQFDEAVKGWTSLRTP